MPSRASASAIKAVEKKGGSVICKYYNDLSLRDCVRGRTDRVAAAPTRREDIGMSTSPSILHESIHTRCVVWYTTESNRGYLAPRVLEKIGTRSFVDERWKRLSEQLGAWKSQEYATQAVKH
jgi:large subunit ribosomal protein L15